MGSSDPKSSPRDNLFPPRTVQPCSIAGRAKAAPRRHWQKSTGPFAKRSPADEYPSRSRLPTLAPASCGPQSKKNDNPQKDNQTWPQAPPGESTCEIHAIAPALRPPASTKNRVAARPSPPPLCATHSKAISRSNITACAAPPAQVLPRDFIRGQNPKVRSVPDRTACAVLPATSCATSQLSSRGDLACRGVKLIYGSAIKTPHKERRISKLQNSNRR